MLAAVVELADTLDLGSSSYECEFKSRQPQNFQKISSSTVKNYEFTVLFSHNTVKMVHFE